MEDRVTIGVPEYEVRLSQELVLGLVTLEPLTVRGEVVVQYSTVQDPGTRLRAQLPGLGGQVNKVGFLQTTLDSRAANDPSVLSQSLYYSRRFYIPNTMLNRRQPTVCSMYKT